MQRCARLDAPAAFELWQLDLSLAPAAHELATLSADEHARAARFVFERDRRRFQAAHVGLRAVLSARTGLAAHALRFVAGPFGKPRLDGTPACSFNLSHSDDQALIVCAADGEIGVDLECLRAVSDAQALAERNFTRSECAELTRAPAAERDLYFLRGWTRKEACLKAIGSGLSIAPESFEAGLSADARPVQIDTPEGRARVELCTLPLGEGWVGALAWRV